MKLEDEEDGVAPPPPPPQLTQPSSSSIPPDHLRCTRTDGKRWRCKGWKVQGRSLCEKHYNLKTGKLKGTGKRKLENTEPVHMQPVDQRVLKKIRESDDDDDDDGFFCLSEEEDEGEEETPLIKRNTSNKRTSEIKGIEKYNISELLSSLKKSPGNADFEMIEKFLLMREDKLKMEKEEAEKQVVHLKEELGIFETMCGQLSNELEEKKREIGVIQETVGELEIKSGVQDELKEYQRVNDELKEKVAHLEKDLATVCARERQSQERFTKMSREQSQRLLELKVKNGDLESARRRADAETELWKRRVKEFQILLSPGSQALRNVDAQPRGLLANVSQPRFESETGHGLSPVRFSHVKVKEETLEYDRGVCASASSGSISHSSPRGSVAEQANNNGSSQIKIQGETNSALNSARLPHVKIEKEPSNCGLKVYTSRKVDFNCSSSPRKSGLSQLAVEKEGTECRQTNVQIEAGSAMNDATKLSTIKIKEEALDCVGTLCTSGGATSICHSTIDGDAKVFSPSRQKVSSLQQSERKKENENSQTKLQGEADSALNGDKLSQIKIKEEALNCSERLYTCADSNANLCSSRGENVKDSTLSRQRLISLQQSEQNGNTVEHIHSEQIEISGATCMQPRNSTAENDREKKGKEVDSDRDDLSSFLCELRRLKANKMNLKGISLRSGLEGA